MNSFAVPLRGEKYENKPTYRENQLNLMVKVSVVIPCYNVEAYLPRCVESVLGQDVPKDWYEVVLVDDGSTDGTPALCDDYAQRYEEAQDGNSEQVSVRVLHQRNTGVAAARNAGVAMARGKMVAFLDSDDWWDGQYLKEMIGLAEQYPDAGLYGCKYWYVKYGKAEDRVRNLQFIRETIEEQRQENMSGYLDYFGSYYAGGAMPIWTGAVMMPKGVLEQMGGFPEGVRLGEDFLLWAKTAMHYRVAYKAKCLSYYYNDVPPTLRLTKRLHEPKAHMDWHLDALDAECRRCNAGIYEQWSQLRDKLRATGLRAYWLSDRYHEAAAEEVKKIDWSHLPKEYKEWYETPRWQHRLHDLVYGGLSLVKQRIKWITRSKQI